MWCFSAAGGSWCFMTTLPQTTTGLHLPRPVGPGAGGAQIGAMAHHQGAATGLSQNQMTGGDVWRVLRSNALFLTIALVVSFALGFILNWYLKAYYARFTATGYVQVSPNAKRADTIFSGNDANLTDDPASLAVEQPHAGPAHAQRIAHHRVLQDPNSEIRKTEWFGEFTKPDGSVDIAAAKEDLAKKFDAIPIVDTKLIQTMFTFRNPKDCKTIVDELVSRHIDLQKKISSDSFINRKNAMDQLRAKHETTMRQLRQDTSRAQGELQMDNTGRSDAINQKETELFQLITARIKVEGDAAEAKSAFDSANAEVQNGGTPGVVDQIVSQNPLVSYFTQMVDQLDVEIQSVSQGPNSDQVQQLIKRRNAAQEKLDSKRAEEPRQSDGFISRLAQLQGGRDLARAGRADQEHRKAASGYFRSRLPAFQLYPEKGRGDRAGGNQPPRARPARQTQHRHLGLGHEHRLVEHASRDSRHAELPAVKGDRAVDDGFGLGALPGHRVPA